MIWPHISQGLLLTFSMVSNRLFAMLLHIYNTHLHRKRGAAQEEQEEEGWFCPGMLNFTSQHLFCFTFTGTVLLQHMNFFLVP